MSFSDVIGSMGMRGNNRLTFCARSRHLTQAESLGMGPRPSQEQRVCASLARDMGASQLTTSFHLVQHDRAYRNIDP